MLINLRNALMTGKRLPYDAEAEYLQSSGTQWINTGVTPTPSDSMRIVADLSLTSINTGDNNIVFGSYIETPTVRQFAFVDRSAKARVAYVGAASGTVTVSAGTDYLFEAQFAAGNSYLNVNGATSSQNTSTAAALPTQPMALFACRYNDSVISPSSMRLRSCKIYLNGILVRDFIPVRKGTVGYLYDRVSGKLFGNAGTGDFLYGSDVHAVEWLEGDGSAYIVLPQSITSSKTTALSIECKYIADVSANNKCVFASYWGSRWYAIGRIQYSAAPVIIARFGNTGQYMRTTDLNGVYTTKIIPSQDKVIENGVEYSATFTAGLNQAVDAIGLFCAYNTNDKSILAVNSSRLYWFNVLSVDGGSIVKNLIPIRVGSGPTWEGAMMDVLTRRIYRNAGTGAFTYGNDLKYPIPAS